MKLKLTAKTIKPYLEKIGKLEMITPFFWDKLSDKEKAEAFNGVGSELTYKWLRKILSWIFRWALCAVIIHDVTWHYKKRFLLTIKDFYKSNKALKINARKQLKDNTKWYDPRYIYRYGNAWRAQMACRILGKKAWEK